ncbi:ATP synthase F1 subunit epsilon [Candidatus Roizmanbacteria bacterium RIFOXYB2_FULL_38_10]|uniref:ATP synthase epsilon chain n=1 Tax=Candidatus Roizmanbacteria bacterium RIFOXYD1_FULL_38_12 TaxID=1802093 RepID=A0A1F7L0C4_9BACT|nr:MAG: ATP synthase F1 subunit epsilon [Candidatus Roizmanbacteria bacterium RIFOXYA2_FULL_38_14]OGK63590.1 MAG: ATP synthase F1 subunit epsilon [Candidatus Roizmanbacteria bacterium RIFOXYA1_FULL_37_12]OGK65436.1 MAG: ATP synthase F1 subunit epsilon [Candidatus Roizmanbacteria bacterium RIFOXYB1_FULL_40_23]OGK69087.1 MAG: ATP synthase F1 subunit epsilon [Candidatus Roizmanbacteria bacterium RIFOXYB2_FULL_38_10]OGK69841.1 MAG: ATP synthase F1 subunit epsilon [Candidatus Roizmanbacteria bacteri
MAVLHLKIITPKRVALEKEVEKITVPSTSGEITILPKHAFLFTLLSEGIVRYKTGREDEYLAIGGGYLETDGERVELLVTRAYGQDAIDQAATEKAIEHAKVEMKTPKDKQQLKEVSSLLRKSLIDMKLLKKKAPKTFSEH